MKKNSHKGKIITGILSFSVLVILFGGLYIPVNNPADAEIIEFIEEESEACEPINGTSDCVDTITFSVIQPPDFKLPPSDKNAVENLLETLFGEGEKRIALEIHSSIYDEAGNILSQSTFKEIPTFDVSKIINIKTISVDNIQIRLNAIVPDYVSSVALNGKVSFHLNNQEPIVKELFVDDSISDQTVPIFIGGTGINRLESFDFTFLDEKLLTGDNKFRVVLNELSGTIQGNGRTETISFTGERIVYELTLTNELGLVGIVDEEGKHVEILGKDNKLQICGTNGESITKIYNKVVGKSGSLRLDKQTITNTAETALPPTVSIFDSNNIKVLEIKPFDIQPKTTECKVESGLERGQTYKIMVGIEEFTVNTPTTQFNINISCHNEGGEIVFSGSQILGTLKIIKQAWYPVCTSNFGYERNDAP